MVLQLQSDPLASRRRHYAGRLLFALFPLIGVILSCIAVGVASEQSSAAPHSSAKAGEKHETQAQAELAKRIADANAVRNSGDPAAVALANQRVISLALREMAQLRLLESSYPQAIELYRRSLEFEDIPDTRVDLAIASLQANRLEDAITESGNALAADAKNDRAYSVRGLALMRKQDYAAAAESLSQAAALNPTVESSYSLAIALLATKDPKNKERAELVFRQMVEMAGDTGSLHVLFGRAYRDAELMPDAVGEFQRAIALDPRTPHAHYFLGLARLTLNEWKPTPEATAEIKKELEYYPRDFLANYMVGFLAASQRQYDVSDKYLKVAAEINPNWPEPWLYMGLNAYALGDMKRAEAALRKAIELTGQDESRSNYQIRRAYVDLGRILTNSGRKDEAEKYLAKARELQNKTMEQTQQSVSAMAVAGGAGAAAAIVPLNKQSENEAAPLLEPTDPFARVDASVVARADLNDKQWTAAKEQEKSLRAVLGRAYNDLATSEAVRAAYMTALAHYQEAERWDPNVPGLAKNLGLCAFRANNYPEAIRGLSRALVEAPQSPAVRGMLGMAYFATDKYADAAKTFASLGSRGMQDSAVGYAWATSLTRTGDLKQASEVLTQFESGNQSNDSLLLIGQLWIEIGDYARSAAALHRALQSDPSLPKAHFYTGLADLRWEHWDEAADEFQAELAMRPNDAEAKYDLAFVYLQQGRTDEAMGLFQQVVSDHPEHANAQYQLGKLLLDKGQIKEGTAHLEIAVQLSPQTDYVHYQLQAAYRKDSRTADADRELEIYKSLKSKSRERATTPLPANP